MTVEVVRRCSWPLLLAAVLACSANPRPATTVAGLVQDGEAVRTAERATVDTVIARLARRAVRRGDDTLDILILSGGGQHGAYGTGFLRGWHDREAAPIPRFDLVTGISTGSLQAPFALLGTPAAIDTLTDLYRNAADRIAPTFDVWFWLRRTGGVVNTSRFDATIDRVVDERLREQLGPEFAADRQLLFGTADFDLGIGRRWDLATVLASGDSGLDRARQLFRAATAIPGIFPPVVYDGHVHADGGVISNILPVLSLDDYRALAERLRATGVGDPVTVRVWVIMNIFTHAPPAVIDPSRRGAMSARTSGLMFYAHHPQVLDALRTLALAVSTDVPGLAMEVRTTAVPSWMATEPGAGKLFDRAWMLRLEELGYQRARSDSAWDATIVSAFERPPSPR